MARSNHLMELSSAIDQASRCMGIQELKPKQLAAVESFVSGKDTFVALPTGYGKSIIFAILPLLFDILFGKPVKTTTLRTCNFFIKGLLEALL